MSGAREAAREEIAKVVYDRDPFAGDLSWPRTAPAEQDRCRRIADELLALPVVQALMDEHAAAELEKAAAAYLFDDGPAARGMTVDDWLDDRAAALRATTSQDGAPL